MIKSLANLFGGNYSSQQRTVREIMHMPHPTFRPSEMLEHIGMAVVCVTKKPFIVNCSDFMLFSIYSRYKFAGSLWAVMVNGRYYGNIVGSTAIISCNSSDFFFKKTKNLIIPLEYGGREIKARVENDGTIRPLNIQMRENDKISVLHNFSKDDSMSNAFEYYKTMPCL